MIFFPTIVSTNAEHDYVSRQRICFGIVRHCFIQNQLLTLVMDCFMAYHVFFQLDAHSKLGTLIKLDMFCRYKTLGQLGNCCKKCGQMGCFASMFPGFLFHVNVNTTFSERRL